MRWSFLLLVGLLLLPTRAAADEPVDYLRDIKPLLRERCYACHGPLKQRSKLRLDTAASIRQGGKSGPSVEPGQPERSVLIARVSAVEGDGRMPPEGAALTT